MNMNLFAMEHCGCFDRHSCCLGLEGQRTAWLSPQHKLMLRWQFRYIDVNRSPKILNFFRISWQVRFVLWLVSQYFLGQFFSGFYGKTSTFSHIRRLKVHNPVNATAQWRQETSSLQITIYRYNTKKLNNFKIRRHFRHFWTTFLVSIELSFGQDL